MQQIPGWHVHNALQCHQHFPLNDKHTEKYRHMRVKIFLRDKRNDFRCKHKRVRCILSSSL